MISGTWPVAVDTLPNGDVAVQHGGSQGIILVIRAPCATSIDPAIRADLGFAISAAHAIRLEFVMQIVCLDLEGVLVPEIWIEFSKRTGIPELSRTTRDEPDYDKLMTFRLDLLREHGLGLPDIQKVIADMGPMPGAREFLDELREPYQVVILSDTFYEFARPLMEQLGRPTLFCHSLEVDADGMLVDYRLRMPDQKREAVKRLQGAQLQGHCRRRLLQRHRDARRGARGILFRPPENVDPRVPAVPGDPELRRTAGKSTRPFWRFSVLRRRSTATSPSATACAEKSRSASSALAAFNRRSCTCAGDQRPAGTASAKRAAAAGWSRNLRNIRSLAVIAQAELDGSRRGRIAAIRTSNLPMAPCGPNAGRAPLTREGSKPLPSGAAAAAHRVAQQAQRLDRVVPAEAGIGDAGAVRELARDRRGPA